LANPERPNGALSGQLFASIAKITMSPASSAPEIHNPTRWRHHLGQGRRTRKLSDGNWKPSVRAPSFRHAPRCVVSLCLLSRRLWPGTVSSMFCFPAFPDLLNPAVEINLGCYGFNASIMMCHLFWSLLSRRNTHNSPFSILAALCATHSNSIAGRLRTMLIDCVPE
jgi:hypothetical protein